MAAKDRFHAVVRIALEKEQWQITDDPLRLEVGGTKFEIDLGAQQLLAAERDQEKIAVEIKTFLSDSPLTDYHAALGQFLNYRLALLMSCSAGMTSDKFHPETGTAVGSEDW